MNPEFIVCANDDNFEIAYDPLASIDDAYPILPYKDDKRKPVDDYLTLKIAKLKSQKDVKFEASSFDEGDIDNASESNDSNNSNCSTIRSLTPRYSTDLILFEHLRLNEK